jgi:1,2-diacylglycerol 3-beta-galactosyltransferase
VYGFVHELGAMMRAAHAVVTKAGPGTICEAFAAGCPVVLFGAIPGQETGNVDFVVNAGAGVWAPRTDQVVQALTHWLIGEDGRAAWARASAAALAAARPQAADAIAAEVLSLATAAPPAARAPSSRVR